MNSNANTHSTQSNEREENPSQADSLAPVTSPTQSEMAELIERLLVRQTELENETKELHEQLAAEQRHVARLIQAEESIKQFMSAIDQSSESIFFTNPDGVILYVNRGFEKSSGYSREELLGKNPRILKSGQHPPSFYKEMWSTLLSGEIYQNRLINRRKDGSLYQEDARITPVKDDEGKITSFVSVKTNITNFLKAQDDLEKANRNLMRSNSELEQFAYIASHDLQEPLRSVSCCLQLLQSRYVGQLDKRADEFIDHAVTASQRMRKLIDDLLAISQIQADTAILIPTDANEVLEHVRANLAVAINESNAQLTYETLPTVNAVPHMLGQLFQNLISNALKFSGDHPPIVKVQAEREGDKWLFSVSDQGIGIEPQHFERIFRLFQRLHTREQYAGTGLGLTICQEIVERHGGRIWIESQPNQGTTFFFTLPTND